MGSWVCYGLGSEADDLPGFVVLTSHGPRRADAADRGAAVVGGLPAEPLPGRPVPLEGRRRALPARPRGRDPRAAARRDRRGEGAQPTRSPTGVDDPEIATRIAQYEMAFRMQTSVPELMDFASEPQSVLDDVRRRRAGDGSLRGELPAGAAAGRARRALHPALPPRLGPPRPASRATSRSRRARSTSRRRRSSSDLKQRGMLDDTLVIWGGEFGRTPMAQGDGRDHHIKGFSHLAGRRRHQGRRRRTARPTSSATSPSRTSCTSTTCTRRCCTCWASTTRGFTLPLPGPRLPPDRRARPRGGEDPGLRPTASRAARPLASAAELRSISSAAGFFGFRCSSSSSTCTASRRRPACR